jgi:hypothetical protein
VPIDGIALIPIISREEAAPLAGWTAEFTCGEVRVPAFMPVEWGKVIA